MSLNVEPFANSWEVSSNCPSQSNFASHAMSKFGSEGAKVCRTLLKSAWSPLAACFHELKPKHYLNVCLEETGELDDKSVPVTIVKKAACKAAAAYVHACAHHNIRLGTPDECLICHASDGQIYGALETHHLKDANVPQSADVMFVVEQKECNRPILIESFDEVAKELDRELSVAGLSDIRYGVVAFGGEGGHEGARKHTARGQLFADSRSVALTLKNMAFAGSKPGDAFGALDLAAKYPFRPGVAKIGLLFLCGECSETSQSVEYSALQRHLLEVGFTLHVLIPKEFQMKSKPQLASQIIGIDAQTAFKGKDIGQKVLIGETELRSHLNGLKDLCYTLAQEVNGSVFRSDLFETRKTNVGKNAKGVFVRRVAASARPSSCQICTCEASDDGTAHPVCRLCAPPKPRTLHDPDYSNGVHYTAEGFDATHDRTILEWIPIIP